MPDYTWPMMVCTVLFLVARRFLKCPQHQRAALLLFMFSASAWLISMGDSWTVDGIPAKYVGFGIAAFATAGLLRINIWYGGPLDPRKDAEGKPDVLPTVAAPPPGNETVQQSPWGQLR